MSAFEIGEKVWYEGKTWEIADHLNKTYLLWKKEGGKEVDGWIAEKYLAKTV